MSTDENRTDQAADEPKPAAPFLSVVSGNPSDEDVAVLTAVFAAASGSGTPVPLPEDKWGRPVDRLRTPWGMPTSFLNRY